MKLIFLFFSIIILLLLNIPNIINIKSNYNYSNNKNIIELTNKNFDNIIKNNNENFLILIYSPNCGHCIRMKSAFENAADILTNKHNIKVGKINGKNEVSLIQRFSTMEGFPSIYYIRNNGNDVREYNGIRTTESFVQFCLKKYKNEDKLGFFESPFSKFAKLKSYIISYAVLIQDLFIYLTDDLGFSNAFAIAILAILGITLTILSMIITVWIVSSNPSQFTANNNEIRNNLQQIRQQQQQQQQ